MNIDNHTKGHLLGLLTATIWGTTFISTKILLETFTPIEILLIRFVIGLIVLSILSKTVFYITDIKRELYFILAGLCGVTLYFLLENIALTYTFASNIGVIVVIAPFFTAILGYFFTEDEKPTLRFFIGFIIALTGVVLIMFNGNNLLKLNPLGDILAVLATLVWSFYSILTKKISKFGFSTVKATQKIFFYGILLMLPTLPFLDFSPSWQSILKPINLFNILFLGIGASALCFVTWNYTVKVIGSVKASAYIYLVPVITVATSAIILKEHITTAAITGAVLALLGLFISENRISMSKLK
jgi:drug/metabolite transporter (DMT)-like permease